MLLTAAGREAAWLCVHQQSQECGHVRSLATTLNTESHPAGSCCTACSRPRGLIRVALGQLLDYSNIYCASGRRGSQLRDWYGDGYTPRRPRVGLQDCKHTLLLLSCCRPFVR